MTSSNLDNLVKAGQLKLETSNETEINGLLQSGNARLNDAKNTSLSLESRFDLAYNAAHALALAALRIAGYRPSNRYVVFQSIPHTTELGSEVWRVVSECHHRRNVAEYEGFMDVTNVLLNDLIAATDVLLNAINTEQ